MQLIKGLTRLRNLFGKVVSEEKEMAEIAREHFKKNAQGLIGFQSEVDKQPKRLENKG